MSRAESHEVGGEGSEAGFSGGEDGGRASQENGEAGSDGLSLRGIVVTFVTLFNAFSFNADRKINTIAVSGAIRCMLLVLILVLYRCGNVITYKTLVCAH